MISTPRRNSSRQIAHFSFSSSSSSLGCRRGGVEGEEAEEDKAEGEGDENGGEGEDIRRKREEEEVIGRGS